MHTTQRRSIRRLMSDLARQRSRRQDPLGPLCVQHSPLAGFQHHAGERLWHCLKVGQPLRLVRERNNPHDANAVAVYWEAFHLGYVPRQQNHIVAHQLDQGLPIEATIGALNLSENPWKRVDIAIRLCH